MTFRASYEKLKTYKACPARYKFIYIDNLQDKFKVPKAEFTLGQHVHTTLKRLLADMPEAERTPERAKELLRTVWRGNRTGFISREQEAEYGQRALGMLDTFFSAGLKSQPMHLEKPVQIIINDGVVLYGRVDRVDRDSSGAIHLIDYKTGSYNPQWIDKGQLSVYSILIKNGLELPLVSASYWFLEQNEFVSFYPTDSDMDTVMDELVRTVDYIQADQNFMAKPGNHCKWCEFIDICPVKSEALAIKKGVVNEAF